MVVMIYSTRGSTIGEKNTGQWLGIVRSVAQKLSLALFSTKIALRIPCSFSRVEGGRFAGVIVVHERVSY